MSTAVIWSKLKPDVEFQYAGRFGEFNGMVSAGLVGGLVEKKTSIKAETINSLVVSVHALSSCEVGFSVLVGGQSVSMSLSRVC